MSLQVSLGLILVQLLVRRRRRSRLPELQEGLELRLQRVLWHVPVFAFAFASATRIVPCVHVCIVLPRDLGVGARRRRPH